MALTPARKTYPQLTAATDVQDGDLLASYRSTGPLKRLTALLLSSYMVKTALAFIDAGTGAIARTVQARLRDEPSPFDYGVVGDGATDDTLAWQAYLNYCYANQRVPRCPRFCKSLISNTLTILPQQVPAASVGGNQTVAFDLNNVLFIYNGTRNKPVIDIGVAPDPLNPGVNFFIESYMGLPGVVASGGSVSWPTPTLTGADTAIRIRRAARCTIKYGYVVGFSKGVEIIGLTYNTHMLRHIVDCKFAMVLTTEGTDINDSFTNENTFIGGLFGHTSNSNGLGSAAHVVFTWDKVASYRGHNCNKFYGSCFESGGAGAGADRIAVWFDGVGVDNRFESFRTEGMFGPLAVCDGAGASSRACSNEFSPLYCEGAGQELVVQQVGGAAGNVVTGPRSHQSHWHSGDMGKIIYASGDDKAAIRGREFFLAIAGTMAANTPSRVNPFNFGVIAHRRAILLDAGGYCRVGVAIDTSVTKDFLCEYSTVTGTDGRICFVALDANGAILGGTATETATNPITGATFANEFYVKAVIPITGSQQLAVAGGTSYAGAADSPATRAVFVTVRPEVKSIWFMVLGGSARVGVCSMSVTSFGYGNVIGSAYPTIDGISALRVFNPLDDGQEAMRASANPATSGVHGFYTRGDFVGNSVAATGAPSGWTCTTTGWLAPAWAISTAYGVPGMLVTNDSGKIYELVTAGTSAGSGGPTGTGSAITDGTCVWNYIGVKAVFAATPNLV